MVGALAQQLEATYGAHVEALQRGTEAALAAHGYDAVVLCSGAATSRNRFDDQHWPLNVTPAFAHWLPLHEPDAFLVLRAGTRPSLVRTVMDDFWDSPPVPETTHFWSHFNVVEVKPGMAGDVLPGGKVAILTRDQGTAPTGAVNPPALIATLDALRTKKSAYELACLAEASRRAVRGHRHVAAVFANGTPSELDLHLAYLSASEQHDGVTPYQNIVALGAHAAVLHYVSYERHAVSGDTSFLVDAGAKFLGYGSDITRTYVRGSDSGARRFRELLTSMEALQLEIIKRITVGRAYEALHDDTHRLLAATLRELGIARGGADELVDQGITRALFPHGLGHSLGVCVHDVGLKPHPPRSENKFLRNTSTIEAGQVFTIEPGIYFIDALLRPLADDSARRDLLDWAAIADLRPFGGIRIEDNVLVEATGTRNLTREAFAAAG